MKALELDLPTFWVCPLEYGEECYAGLEPEDVAAIEAFIDEMVRDYGQCWPLDYGTDDGDFRRYHDATRFGVLACHVVTITFDITQRRANR